MFDALPANSLVLILVSSFVGGFVGASLKFVFEVLLPNNIKQRKQANEIFDKFSNPTIRSADALRSRIANFTSGRNERWFDTSPYYKMITLYIFASYFAWVEILYRKLDLLRFQASKRSRRLHYRLNHVEKSFNNIDYFYPLLREDLDKVYQSALPKYYCKAIGEKIILDASFEHPAVMDFTTFYETYQQDPAYRELFQRLEFFLSKIANQYHNLHWDRVILVQMSLLSLLSSLDIKHVRTRKYKVSDYQLLMGRINYPTVKEVLFRDIYRYNLKIRLSNRFRHIRNRLQYRFDNLHNNPYHPIRQQNLEPDFSYDCTGLDLSQSHNRRKLYLGVGEQAKDRAFSLPYATRQGVMLLNVGPPDLQADVLGRIPGNLATMSGNCIDPEKVIINLVK